MLGIPDFKLEKSVVTRRVQLMQEEGIEFRTGVHVGVKKKKKKITLPNSCCRNMMPFASPAAPLKPAI